MLLTQAYASIVPCDCHQDLSLHGSAFANITLHFNYFVSRSPRRHMKDPASEIIVDGNNR
jgi:hypothetical protein